MMILPAESGAETDWLDLGQRHEKKVEKISYYNIIGNIEISQVNNALIIDKSDREGLLETQPFKDLKQLVRTIIIDILEKPFISKRREHEKLAKGLIREPKKLQASVKDASKILDKLGKGYNFEIDPLQIFETLGAYDDKHARLVNLSDSLKNLQQSLKLMQEVQDLLTEQAGYGLSIGVAVHEISKITANFYYGVKALIDSGKLDITKLKELEEASLNIKSELNRLAPQRAVKNEPPIEFNIRKSIDFES